MEVIDIVAYVYKQAYEAYPNNTYDTPIEIDIVGDEMFAKIDCEDCDGTGQFHMPDNSFELCICCKGTGKVDVTLY